MKSRETSGLKGKQTYNCNWFPKGPYIKCFVIYLHNHTAKTNKQRRAGVCANVSAGNNCVIVFRSGYI